MMKIFSAVTTAATLLGAGAVVAYAAGDQAKSESKEAVREIGAPVNCVNIRNIRSTHVIDDETIDFRMTGGKTYRNKLNGKCPGLGIEERFSYRRTTSQLCNVDIITVLNDFGGQLQSGASCGLGKFQQIEKVKSE